MSIIRTKKRDNPFVQLDKTPIEDVRLSWKAKGLLAYLVSRPNDWQVYVSDLINRAKDGRDSVYAGMKELENTGYLKKVRVKGERGKFSGWEYEIYETPQQSNTSTENGFSEYGKTEYGKSDTTNNNLTNNDLNTTTTNTTEDDVDKLANHFVELRGKGLLIKPTDYQSIMRVLDKVPLQKAISLLEQCFSERKGIHTFSYCENYILEHYDALIARQQAVAARKAKEEDHANDAIDRGRDAGDSKKEPKIQGTLSANRKEQKQRLVGENGEIPDFECDY